MPPAHLVWLLPGCPQSLDFPAASGLLERFPPEANGCIQQSHKIPATLWARGLIQLPGKRSRRSRRVILSKRGGLREKAGGGPGTGTLPSWWTSSEVSTGKAASGKRLFRCMDAPLFPFMFPQCYLVLPKQAINSVIWVSFFFFFCRCWDLWFFFQQPVFLFIPSYSPELVRSFAAAKRLCLLETL